MTVHRRRDVGGIGRNLESITNHILGNHIQKSRTGNANTSIPTILGYVNPRIYGENMIWFTSDTHFGHANILKYQADTRIDPITDLTFPSVGEMDRFIINEWNAHVFPGDTVYHLGDFAFHHHGEYADRLNGNIVLIPGTHDKMNAKDKKRFQIVSPIHEIDIDGRHLVLCHYALRVWSRSHYGSIHLYGHSHGHLPPLGLSFDVGVDRWGLQPLSSVMVMLEADQLMKESGTIVLDNRRAVELNEKEW
jgi:calcineurin-like phosphoesterase family protein